MLQGKLWHNKILKSLFEEAVIDEISSKLEGLQGSC
jgi:hypothetical protein